MLTGWRSWARPEGRFVYGGRGLRVVAFLR